MPYSQPGEYELASWTEIFCQCLPLRTKKASAEPDIEMQNMPSSSSDRYPAVNNPVVPSYIVRANNPDNIQRPSHTSWWLRDDESCPSAAPSRSGARNPIAASPDRTPGPVGLRTPTCTPNPGTHPRPSSSDYLDSDSHSSGPSWRLPAPSSIYSSHPSEQTSINGPHLSTRIPRISPRAASYAAVLDVQAGIDARRSEVVQQTPPSPTGSVDSIDFFSGAAARVGFGDRVQRSGGRATAPVRPQRVVGSSPYIA
ncbi:hypothetical protein E4T48_04033 [Aureobasidium sp. EXF-10727]|nr:hypothetical protein E4T48_04033 [Aureobasidium sp. EXF-10727]